MERRETHVGMVRGLAVGLVSVVVLVYADPVFIRSGRALSGRLAAAVAGRMAAP